MRYRLHSQGMKRLPVKHDLDDLDDDDLDDELEDDPAELDEAVLTFFRDEAARPNTKDKMNEQQRAADAMRAGVARADAADAAEASKQKKKTGT